MKMSNFETTLLEKQMPEKKGTVIETNGIPRVMTPFGELIIRHSIDPQSRKKESPVKYYKNGNIRSVPLNEASPIKTPMGIINAELVTFYESGKLRRIFPLDGKITGYWTEANEYKLAPSLSIPTSVGTINIKPIYIEFHESGTLKSILFWPQERVEINTPAGVLKVRKGISFYESGALKNIEPCKPVKVTTPIGPIKAFQPDPQGMLAEDSGICFDEQGAIASVLTIHSEVHVTGEPPMEKIFSPRIVPSYCNDSQFFVEPLLVRIEKDMAMFYSNKNYLDMISLNSNFTIKEFTASKPIAEVSCQI